MTKMMIAATIAATSLFSLKLSAYEAAADLGATGALLKVVLTDTRQSGDAAGFQRLTAAEQRGNLKTLEASSENLCSAKTFCSLD